MRLFLFIAGVFAVIVCIEKPAEAEQTVPGASIRMAKAAAVVRSAVMQHCNNAWLIGSGVAPDGPSPYPASPESHPSTRPWRR
jgi:hypothetical protein